MRTRIFVALGLLAALVPLRELRLRAHDQFRATQRYEDVYYVPPPEWLPVLSLGHREALADLLWLKALVYFGEELSHRGEVRHAFDYAEAIAHLDPYFKRAYRWIGMAAIYRTGTVTAADARRAADFLERGARIFPDDGELAWDLGATLAYELAPLLHDAREKEEVKTRGIEHLALAARLGAGPPWLALSNAAQLRRLGHAEQAIRHLEEMYATVRDPDTKEQIRLHLEQLRSRAYAEAFVQAHRELEQNRRRDFPYVPPTLYLLLGHRPPVDSAALRRSRYLRE